MRCQAMSSGTSDATWNTASLPLVLPVHTVQNTGVKLIDRIAALVPPPRVHRHRYHGVLAPNSPLRAQVTALARDTATTVCPGKQARESRQPAECADSWRALMRHVQGLPQSQTITDEDIAAQVDAQRSGR